MAFPPQILLVDNYDSFTYNLYDYLAQLGAECTVIRNDEYALDEIQKMTLKIFLRLTKSCGIIL